MVKKNQGFTLIELMIVIAIIAIIAAIAIPNLLSARVSANESNAISTLRNLVSAQAQFQSSGAMDEDGDGTGEYGSFGELSGAVNLQRNSVGVAARLNPPILPATFQVIDGNGRAQKSGYLFLMYLPDNAGAGVPEVVTTGGAGATVDPNTCEAVWCCYAWPVTPGTTGNRAFFVNQRGEILQTKMDALPYDTTTNPGPAADAAFTTAGSITVAPALNAVGQDGNTWTPLG